MNILFCEKEMSAYKDMKYGRKTYKGFVINDVQQGEGQLIWKSGTRYIGNFNNGVREGFGVFFLVPGRGKKVTMMYEGN